MEKTQKESIFPCHKITEVYFGHHLCQWQFNFLSPFNCLNVSSKTLKALQILPEDQSRETKTAVLHLLVMKKVVNQQELLEGTLTPTRVQNIPVVKVRGVE